MIKQEEWQGIPVYTMQNDKCSVSLCPSLNNNLYRMWDHVLQREVLRVPDSPKTLQESPIHYGTPILMPPNRIRKGTFNYEGRTYQLNINKPDGNHIHGVLGHLPWKVANIQDSEEQCAITSTFSIADFPDVFAQYPHALELEVTYELKGSTLLHKLKATNHGDITAPFGYGLHTWFLLDHQPQNWTFQLPAAGVWELDKELMPTGQILPLDQYEALPEGIKLEGQNMDTVFQIGENPRLAVLKGPGCEIRYSAAKDIKHWVIYTKGEADNDICLEPYTWVTNAPNLDLDAEVTGLLGIKPGQTLELDIVLEIVHT